MKKTILIIPALFAMSLSGCSILNKLLGKNSSNNGSDSAEGSGNEGGSGNQGGSQGGGATGTFIINLSATGISVAEGVYPTESNNFTVNNVSFTANNGVGVASSSYNAGMNALKCMQFNKAENGDRKKGAITNSAALSVTTVEITWYATYASEDTQYFPIVKAGAAANSLSAVSCNQTSTLTGESTGTKDGSYDIYKYVTTYNVSGKGFLSLEGSASTASFISQFKLS